MDIFLQKRIDSRQEAFIHPLEPCVLFIMNECTLLHFFQTVERKHPPTVIIKLKMPGRF